MRYISICSGIEAASAAWVDFGFTPIAFSEIDRFASNVLDYRYPNVPNVGDFTEFDWSVFSGSVDLLVAGTPCQAFSICGSRGSLSDYRGYLTLRFVDAVESISPRVLLWENVPGILSAKDNPFGSFIGAIVGSSEAVVFERGWPNAGLVNGPSRSAAWRVLDAQYFGVPQRRKRLFVVASDRGSTSPAEVLFEQKSEGWNLKSRVSQKERSKWLLPCLTRRGPGSLREEEAYIVDELGVRHMTPEECEAIQGFPRGYTNIHGAADGPRYKALGNSMAVPVMAWIGKRINEAYAKL